MPLWVTTVDDAGHEIREMADEVLKKFVEPLQIASLRLTFEGIILMDADGRETVQVTRGTYPGAGFSVTFGDHVDTKEMSHGD